MPTVIDPRLDIRHAAFVDRSTSWTPIQVARPPWCGQSAPLMRLMFRSMTTPISVSLSVDDAVSFVQRSIAGQIDHRLTEETVQNVDLRLQLYCLSYRHDHQPKEHGYHRVRRITTVRLRLAIAAVREHAADFGYTHYSIWIDSLLLPRFRRKPSKHEVDDDDDEHEAYSEAEEDDDKNSVESEAYEDYQWGDRALLPYALCHVVAVPSYFIPYHDSHQHGAEDSPLVMGSSGFGDDLQRAWIRCEHQLAASTRGLILPPTVRQTPVWTQSQKLVQNGIHYVKYAGGNMDCVQALRMLAMLICSGFLGGTRATYREDVALLKEWAMSVMCNTWRRERVSAWTGRPRLPGRTKTAHEQDEVDEHRVMNLMENAAMVQMRRERTKHRLRLRSSVIALQRVTYPDHDQSYIASKHRQNPFYNTRSAYDERLIYFDPIHHLLRAMLVYHILTPVDGLHNYLLTNLRSRCITLAARFAHSDGHRLTAAAAVAAAARSHRGLVCYFLPKWGAVPIVMDVELRRENGVTVVCGYRIVHAEAVREAMGRAGGGLLEFERWSQRGVTGVIESLNVYYYSRLERGLMCVDLAKTSGSMWFVRA